MAVTVRDVLGLDTLSQAKILAGEAGLDRVVRYITVGEEPDLPDWIFGGELILSTLFAISPDQRSRHVRRLSRRGSVGLFVKPERFIGQLSGDVIQAANSVAFPLVEVPSNVLWSRVLAAFYQTALQEQIEKVQVETEMRLRGGFVEELLSGVLGAQKIVQRARYLGCDLSTGGTVLIFDIKDFSGIITSDEVDGAEIRCNKDLFWEIVNVSLREITDNFICTIRSDNVLVVVGGASEGTAIANQVLLRCCERLQHLSVHAGVGRPRSTPDELFDSFHEAETALKIGRALHAPPTLVHEFEKLSIERLLFDLGNQNPSPLKKFRDETLDLLIRYDTLHDTHLVQTLRVYLESDGNISEAAERLYAHRHTVRYRLRRVRDITGLDVSHFEDAARLFLAIKAASIT